MRLSKSMLLIPVLALTVMACGPRRPCMGHGEPCKGGPGMHAMAMPHGCGPESCFYQSHCFSSGAVRSNDGVCQACSGGKWVATTGCSEHGMCGDGHGCDKRKGGKPKPCHGGDGHRHHDH